MTQLTELCDDSRQCSEYGTGLIIYVRARPWHETDYAQVLIPVALSYETFVCKLCVALEVDRGLVKKVLKSTDILIRNTEDVIRLRPNERLELVLHNSVWKQKAAKQFRSITPWLNLGAIVLFLALFSALGLNQKEILNRLQSIGGANGNAQMQHRLETFETDLLTKLSLLDAKLDRTINSINQLVRSTDAVQQRQTMDVLLEQFQQMKTALKRKLKMKDDDV